MLREAFYYLLGGVTFLPLCIFGVVVHFYWNAPSVRQTAPTYIDADVDLTHEKKLAALDLAAQNAALHAEIENAKGKDHPQGDATAPSTAKRLGPGPSNASAPKPYFSGWLTVRPTFESDKDATASSNGNTTGPAAIPAPLIENRSDPSKLQSKDEAEAAEGSDGSTLAAKSTAATAGSGYMSQVYRGILDYRIGRTSTKKQASDASTSRSTANAATSTASQTGTAGKESFYCILKSPILYLYSSDDVASPNTECHAAIDLRSKRVSIFVAGLGDTLGELDPEQPSQSMPNADEQLGDAAADQEGFEPARAWKKAKRAGVRDGELFMKRNAIRIVGSANGRSLSPDDREAARASYLGRRRPQWFIFCKNNYVMEDWYHALLQASLLPDSNLPTKQPDRGPFDPLQRTFGRLDDPIGPTFSREDMASLLVSLDSLPDPLPLRWLNALVGRIFFSVYRTAWLEDYIISKMMKKINRVKTPGFLGDIKVEQVDVGRRAPGFSRPMLKALTTEGEASMEIAVHYVGEVRITISTTLTLSLGSRFKPYNIPVVLAVVLRSLEGNLLLHVKKPPSNRLWFGFTTMPKMEIDIEPVVSERKVQWGMVTRLIESRLRELLNESIVVPNMDDISFFDTRSLPLRGGIFADAAKKGDMSYTEGKDASVAATPPSATYSTRQEREEERTSGNIKTSELLAANRVGTASAPVSGTATPATPDRGDESTPRDMTAEEDAEASSVDAGAPYTSAVRNRKNRAEASAVSKEPSLSAMRTASPAAAGLSDLLSRDLAAGGGSLSSGSPPRQEAHGNKRRTWFGTGPKSSVSSISSSSALPSLGFGSTTLGSRSGREQSSLALGNASIERPSQRSHSASVSSKGEAALSVPADASARAVSDSVNDIASNAFARRSNSSVASARSSTVLPTEDSERDAYRAYESDRVPASTTATPVHSSATPSLVVSSSSEPLLKVGDAGGSAALSHETESTLEALAVHELQNEQTLVDRPPSSTHSMVSPIRSPSSDNILTVAKDAGGSGERSTEALNELDFVAATRQNSRGSGGMHAASDAGTVMEKSMPPPPPPRRPTTSQRGDRIVPRQNAAAALSSVQRGRYGLHENDRGAGDGQNATTGSTSAILLTSWNKAKASMADKESRQAAARDAKDAIKRGWANWNTKRAEAKRSPAEDDDTVARYGPDSLPRSHSSRLSLVPGKSAWLASSPPDPTSFGLGFDKSSPEDTRSGFQDRYNSTGIHAGGRSSLTDTDDDIASVHSNSSSRRPYRELRASKKVPGFDGAVADRASDGAGLSNSSSKLASNPSLLTARTNATSGESSRWDAEIPSLTPPAPAFHDEREKEGVADSKRKTLETVSNDTVALATPPALPQRKPSSSISSSGHVGGVVSFIPPAPSATTELASTSSLSASEITPGECNAEESETPSSGVNADPAPLVQATQVESCTPERRADIHPQRSSSEQGVRTAIEGTSPLAEEQASTQISDAAALLSSEANDTAQHKAANEGRHAVDATETAPSADKASATQEQPWSPMSTDVSSPILGSGIKKQPGRATMMAVPGIPSMQKAGPQSFSAPPPPEPAAAPRNDAETSPSAFRASSLFKMPAFGSPILNNISLKGPRVNSSTYETDTTVPGSGSVDSPSKQSQAIVQPTVLVRPPADVVDGDAGSTKAEEPGSVLGLTHTEEASPLAEKALSKENAQQVGGSSAEEIGSGQSSAVENQIDNVVSKPEGLTADPRLEHAQADVGDMLQAGSTGF